MAMVHRERRRGREVVVKQTSYDATIESEGLAALGAAGARVPEVVEVGPRLLVTEAVEGDGDWAAFAVRLAEVHRHLGDTFGWHRDGVIGPLPMPSTPMDDWPTFFAACRLMPWVDDLPAGPARRLRAAIDDGRLAVLLDHDVAPSLVHGDLWSGNVVGGEWLIDPAVHHADRELDLAMADLFGGFARPFWDAYARAWPLDEDWERRRRALQLFHLLVHVRLFGGGYVGQVVARLDALGW